MASIENQVLQVLSERGDYAKYREFVPEEIFSPVGRRLLGYVDKFWESYDSEGEIDWNDFALWLKRYAAPKDTHLEAMELMCRATWETEHYGVARDVLNRAVEQDVAEQIEGQLEREEGLDTARIRELVNEVERFRSSDLEKDDLTISTDIEEIIEDSHVSDDGLPFSLDILRKSIGPLRPGDTVFVPARIEVGKTTFLLNQADYMIGNTENTNAVVFSNEEDGNRLMIRLYQIALGWSTKDVLSNPTKAKTEYRRKFGSLDRIKVVHAARLHKREVERAIEKHNPSLVVFNMLSKIQGFGNSRYQNDVDMFLAQGAWMRELANGYNCAALTAWQAGGQAHGKPWIEADDMYGSKTGVPGEADVIIGIGKVENRSEPENHRYIHLAKNKLAGDSKTDERLRHGFFDGIYINEQTGVFYE